ncbi:MAG: peptidoglycan-binding protein [Deltaproteobacteria bacterium]|nr:peptidoglycan-binding protein [Deltaproteobacteria bacterium]
MNSIAVVETPAGINRLYYFATLISNVLYKNSAVDHQTLATYIHRLIEADHPPEPTSPGQLPPELTFGRDLIGFSEKQQERIQIANAQAALLKLGFKVGKVDGKLGSQTKAAVKAFQKKRNLKVDGKITEGLMVQLKIAMESMPTAEPSPSDRVPGQ